MKHRRESVAVGARVLAAGRMIALVALGFALGCHGRDRAATISTAPSASGSAQGLRTEDPDPYSAHVAELDMTRGLPESGHAGLLAAPSRRTFAEATKLLSDIEAGRERQIKGLLVLFGMARVGFSRAQEVGDALARIRASGTPVICHAHELSNGTYWMAARGCDRIWISPAGGVDTVGIAGQVVYVRRMLGELRVDVDMLQVGKFKGASEPLTRDGPSDEAKESLLGVLRSIRASWLDGMETARPGKDIRSVVEAGPWSPREATERGLADGVGYEADARAEARARAGVDNVVTRFGAGAKAAQAPGLVEFVRVLSGAQGGGGRPHVAVIRATGAISTVPSSSPFGDSDGIALPELTRALEKVRKDDAARAVVLRIDSPGGSALASDLLWNELMTLRALKPVVVSVGDMAASGGYYLACTGTRIFAEPTSIVGSIGVVGGKLSFGRTMDRVGVTSQIFPASSASGAGARAAYLSPFDPWDDSTRDRMLSTMTSVYDLFLERVAQGRGTTKEKVATFAEGRIHAAREALALGMVDEMGGLQAAIAHARRAGGLEPDAPAELIAEESGLIRVLGLDEGDVEDRAPGSLFADAGARAVLASYAPDLLHFAAAFEPILRGEHTLVAVPFAFLVR